MLQIQANGLTNDVKLGKTEIRVCDKPCEINESGSDSAIFSCNTPAISTKKSNSEFKIREEANLKGESVIFSGMAREMAQMMLDDTILPAMRNTGESCFVGVKFPDNYIGIVNEISFFMDEFDPSMIVDSLFIEASTDNFNSSIEHLVTISDEVHEGWNYYDLTSLSISNEFQYFRVRSFAPFSGCDGIGEIHFIGYEVIDDDSSAYDCKIEHVEISKDAADGVPTETKTDLNAFVSYDMAITPVVDDIQPRWGAVSGGTQITFEGRNYSSLDVADYTVTIDDVDCPVDSVTPTELKCTTAPRIGEWKEDPKLEITM